MNHTHTHLHDETNRYTSEDNEKSFDEETKQHLFATSFYDLM